MLTRQTLKRIGAGLGLGLALGIGMVILGIDWRDATIGEQSPGLWKALNAPALWTANWWIAAGLPPNSEAAWVVTPAMMVVLQWSLTGSMIGMWWGMKSAPAHE